MTKTKYYKLINLISNGMQIKIYNRNFDLTDPFKKYLEEKFSSLDKYQEDISDIKVELIRDQHHNKGEVFTVEVHISFAHQKPIMARETNIDARAAVDLAESKLSRQIIKNKEKHTSKMRRGAKIIKSLKFWRKE